MSWWDEETDTGQGLLRPGPFWGSLILSPRVTQLLEPPVAVSPSSRCLVFPSQQARRTWALSDWNVNSSEMLVGDKWAIKASCGSSPGHPNERTRCCCCRKTVNLETWTVVSQSPHMMWGRWDASPTPSVIPERDVHAPSRRRWLFKKQTFDMERWETFLFFSYEIDPSFWWVVFFFNIRIEEFIFRPLIRAVVSPFPLLGVLVVFNGCRPKRWAQWECDRELPFPPPPSNAILFLLSNRDPRREEINGGRPRNWMRMLQSRQETNLRVSCCLASFYRFFFALLALAGLFPFDSCRSTRLDTNKHGDSAQQ